MYIKIVADNESIVELKREEDGEYLLIYDIAHWGEKKQVKSSLRNCILNLNYLIDKGHLDLGEIKSMQLSKDTRHIRF